MIKYTKQKSNKYKSLKEQSKNKFNKNGLSENLFESFNIIKNSYNQTRCFIKFLSTVLFIINSFVTFSYVIIGNSDSLLSYISFFFTILTIVFITLIPKSFIKTVKEIEYENAKLNIQFPYSTDKKIELLISKLEFFSFIAFFLSNLFVILGVISYLLTVNQVMIIVCISIIIFLAGIITVTFKYFST